MNSILEKKQIVVQKLIRYNELAERLQDKVRDGDNKDQFDEAKGLESEITKLNAEIESEEAKENFDKASKVKVPFVPHGRILVIAEPESKEEQVTPGGILIPQRVNNDSVKIVTIAAIDPNLNERLLAASELQENSPRFKVGDRVLVARLTATKVIIGGIEYELNRKEDILGVFTDESSVSCPARILPGHFPTHQELPGGGFKID